MSIAKIIAVPFAAALVFGVSASPRASAFDVGLDVGVGKKPPVVVQPPPETTRHWVPDTVVRKEERVIAEPHRVERREEKVLVEPAHVVKKEERVLVPDRIEKRTEQVLVRPARIERQWVPAVVKEEVKIGPLHIDEKKDGYFRDVQVPPVYETVVKDVVVPAHTDVVVRNVEVPARYEIRTVEVPVAPRYEVVYKDVVVPGHWEETTVVPPAVVVKPARPGFELDVDVKNRH